MKSTAGVVECIKLKSSAVTEADIASNSNPKTPHYFVVRWLLFSHLSHGPSINYFAHYLSCLYHLFSLLVGFGGIGYKLYYMWGLYHHWGFRKLTPRVKREKRGRRKDEACPAVIWWILYPSILLQHGAKLIFIINTLYQFHLGLRGVGRRVGTKYIHELKWKVFCVPYLQFYMGTCKLSSAPKINRH